MMYDDPATLVFFGGLTLAGVIYTIYLIRSR